MGTMLCIRYTSQNLRWLVNLVVAVNIGLFYMSSLSDVWWIIVATLHHVAGDIFKIVARNACGHNCQAHFLPKLDEKVPLYHKHLNISYFREENASCGTYLQKLHHFFAACFGWITRGIDTADLLQGNAAPRAAKRPAVAPKAAAPLELLHCQGKQILSLPQGT